MFKILLLLALTSCMKMTFNPKEKSGNKSGKPLVSSSSKPKERTIDVREWYKSTKWTNTNPAYRSLSAKKT